MPSSTILPHFGAVAAEPADHLSGAPERAVKVRDRLPSEMAELFRSAVRPPAVGMGAEEQLSGEILRGGTGGLGAAAHQFETVVPFPFELRLAEGWFA